MDILALKVFMIIGILKHKLNDFFMIQDGKVVFFMVEYLEILLGGQENFKVVFFIIVNGLINFQKEV